MLFVDTFAKLPQPLLAGKPSDMITDQEFRIVIDTCANIIVKSFSITFFFFF